MEDVIEKMSAAEFVRTVRRKYEKQIIEKGSINIHWGPQVYVEYAMGEQIKMETSYAMILITSPCS